MKKLFYLAVALSMCFVLSACNGTKTSDATSENTPKNDSVEKTEEVKESTDVKKEDEVQEKTITMWTFLDPTNTSNGRSQALAKMIEEFEAENQGVKVNVEPQDYATMTAKFLAATVTGDAPDLIWCARDELCGVLDAGALEPLENLFLNEWSEKDIADIKDAYFNFGERDGKHYILALSKNAIMLYYRSDLLKEAGKNVPTTWEEIVDVAKALTADDKSTGIKRYGLGQGFSGVGSDSPLLANYIIDKQGDLFAEDGKANWANEIGKEAMDWTAKCIELGITPSESVNTTGEDMMVEFQSGKYGMIICGAVRVPTIRNAVSFDPSTVQITSVPGGCVLDGWFIGVWSGSKNKKEAGKFLEKMYSPESDLKWVEMGGQAPVRHSTLDKLTIDNNTQYLSDMVDAFENGWFVSNSRTYSGWKINLNECIQAVIGNGTDSMKALKDAADQFNSANNR